MHISVNFVANSGDRHLHELRDTFPQLFGPPIARQVENWLGAFKSDIARRRITVHVYRTRYRLRFSARAFSQTGQVASAVAPLAALALATESTVVASS
jgi:hypothetical protein